MAHHHLRSGYQQLAARLNKFPQGAPPSELLYRILSLLFSPKEAELVALLPIKVFTADQAARAWKMDLKTATGHLDDLAGRAILVDIEQNGRMHYCLPPPMAGFFEFSMMRVRSDIDQHLLAELFYQYINVEEDFVKALFTQGETQLGRVMVRESAIAERYHARVLDYERASHIIDTAFAIGISQCYCRHKMAHVGRACKAPRQICMTFNHVAASLIRHGHARAADTAETLDLLATAQGHHLVQFGENVRREVSFICNCCKCCCEAMLAAQRFALHRPVHTTNFIADIDADACVGCRRCRDVCPVAAIDVRTTTASNEKHRQRAAVRKALCLGCGVCVSVCPSAALSLVPRAKRVITPLNTAHRSVIMAIERGTLQHIIFDNQVLKSHHALAALLGVILRLSPIRQALASRQLKSRYLETLITRLDLQPAVHPSLSN